MTRRPTARLPLIPCAIAGFVAGTVATAAQMLLWWLEATPVIATLLRDARLTAAIVLGRGVLDEGAGWRWDVMAWATLIHFGLSLVYALVAGPVARRLADAPALAAGAAYGLAIYIVNLHGFTWLFPWFVVSRGWVTILTHVVFGVTLLGALRMFARTAGDTAAAGRARGREGH